MATIDRLGLNFRFDKATIVDKAIAFSRASTATRINPSTGLVESVAANVPRLTRRQEIWKAGASSSTEALPEVSTVDFTGATDEGLAGKHLTLADANGPVYVWFDWNPDWQPDPAPGGRGIRVTLPDEGNTTSNLAEQMKLVLDADPAFLATRSGAVVTITDAVAGVRTNISAGTSGLAVAVTQQGSAAASGDNPVVFKEGFLIEGAATNLAAYSGIYSGWTLGAGTRTQNYGIAPDGTQTSTRIQGGNYTYLSVAHEACVFSVWAKAPTSGVFVIEVGNSTALAAVGTAWQRIYLASAGSRTEIVLSNLPADIEFWGAQLETGTVPTSYIPTSGAPATRAADVPPVDVSKIWNAQEGTIIVEADGGAISADANRTLIDMSKIGAPASERLLIRRNAGQADFTAYVWHLGAFQGTASISAPGPRNRIALSYGSGGLKASVNGGTPVTLAVPFPTVEKLWLGTHMDAVEALNGTLQQVAYYPYAQDDLTLQASSELK
jgi:hypothetical protein